MPSPSFTLHSSQHALRVDRRAFLALARRLALRAFGPDAPFESVSVLLVDDRAMPDYKFRTFGLRLQTDVISLSYAPLPGVPPSAELVVNAERALLEGARRPGGPPRELALYLAHAFDHLAGHDDDTPSRRRSMRRRENAWLATDPLAPLAFAPLLRP